MADSKFPYVRALVQGGSLTNLATASPWTVSHSGGTGLTLTAASRIRAESGSIGRAATLCAEAVASLDMALVGSTVLAAGRATLVVGASGNQLACELDGVQVASLYLPLSSQRALFAIEYGPDGANENYFFRATGESSGGTVTTTASVPLTASAGSSGNLVVAGGPLIGTASATPSQGTVNVATTRPGVLANAVPHIVSFSQANAAAGFTDRQAASTGGSLSITASRAGSADVTYTITNTAGLTLAGMCSVLVVGIAGLIGGSTSFLSGASRVATATTATGANWLFLLSTPGLSFPAEPGTPIAATMVTGTGLVVPQVVQGGVYGAIGASVTQRDVISLSLPAANASMSLSVSLQPTLNATASMANIATGLDSLVAQISAVGFTASWQQIGTDQYVINTERQTPGGFTLSASLNIDTSWIPNPITTLHAMRVTTAARYTAVGGVPDEFPMLPWPTTSIPPGGGGGTGWGTLPADVIFAVPAESNGNDVAQFGLSATASGTATLQASGSRTSDGYLRNTDGAQMADACFGYTPSSGFQTAWGAAQSMTLEFDIRVDTGAYLGGQILGVGNGNTVLTSGGTTGVNINGSPFATSAGSADLTPNTWHHIAFVADYNAGSRVIRCYRDGVQQDTPQSVGSFGFNDYPNPTTIGLLQLYAGFIGNGALKGGLDNIVITTRAKYNANFTPGSTFAEIVGYTPPPSNVDVTAAGYNDLDAITGTGTFNTQLTAPDAYFFSTVTLDDSVSTGDAYTVDGNSINFTGPRTLAATTCVGTFVRGTPQNFDSGVTLDDNTAVSTFFADTTKEWTGEATLEDVTSFGLMMFLAPAMFSGESVVDDAYGLTSGFEVITPPSANATAVLPAVTAAARTGHKAAAVMPTPFVTSSATTRSPAGSVLTLPSLTAVIRGGHRGAATLPALIVSAQVTTTQMLRAQVTLPALTVVSTARVSGQGAVQGFVPALSVAAWGGHQAETQLPGLSATAHVVSGVVARVQGSLPSITAYATGYRQDTMRAEMNLPALVMTPSGTAAVTLPRLTATSTGQPVITATHEAYVLNMNRPLDDNPRNNFEAKNEQVTRYTNWPFFQVVRMGNAYYGVAEDGLYELGGATDNGAAVAWNFETCKTDFKDPHRKAVASAYIGGQSGAELTYTLRSGDDTDRMYDYVTTKTVQKRNHRQKFGLGRRVRYYSFGLAGDGAAAIDSIEFELLTTTRRV